MLTRNAEFADRVRTIANHGVLPGTQGHQLVGTNSRLATFQAAILIMKLEVFEAEVVARRRVAKRYLSALSDACEMPVVGPGVAPVWSYFAIRHAERDSLMAHLADRGIRSFAYYRKPIHLEPACSRSSLAPGGLPGTMAFSERLLCLPCHPYIRDDEIEKVIDAVRAFGIRRFF